MILQHLHRINSIHLGNLENRLVELIRIDLYLTVISDPIHHDLLLGLLLHRLGNFFAISVFFPFCQAINFAINKGLRQREISVVYQVVLQLLASLQSLLLATHLFHITAEVCPQLPDSVKFGSHLRKFIIGFRQFALFDLMEGQSYVSFFSLMISAL